MRGSFAIKGIEIGSLSPANNPKKYSNITPNMGSYAIARNVLPILPTFNHPSSPATFGSSPVHQSHNSPSTSNVAIFKSVEIFSQKNVN